MKKMLLFLAITLLPLPAFSATPRAPILGTPQIISPTQIRWPFKNTDPSAVAFELRNELTRSAILKVDNPQATYIDETNVIPADPDGFCARYVVAINKQGERSFGQTLTYPCVRTPPVTPPAPVIKILDNNVLHIVIDCGANDPATGIGVFEEERGAWVSPEHLFTATPNFLTIGGWSAKEGVFIPGLRANTSYSFVVQAQSVTGEKSKPTAPVHLRLPAEAGEMGAPVLDRLGELGNLRTQTLLQTFVTGLENPVIVGLIPTGSLLTVDIDDRPHAVKVQPESGPTSSFAYRPGLLSSGLHTMRLGAISGGRTAWTPTIEFRVK